MMKQKKFVSLLQSSGFASKEEWKDLDENQAMLYMKMRWPEPTMPCNHCADYNSKRCPSEEGQKCEVQQKFLKAAEIIMPSTIPTTLAMTDVPWKDTDQYKDNATAEPENPEFNIYCPDIDTSVRHPRYRSNFPVVSLIWNDLTAGERGLAMIAASTFDPEPKVEIWANMLHVSVRQVYGYIESVNDKANKAIKEGKYISIKAEDMEVKS